MSLNTDEWIIIIEDDVSDTFGKIIETTSVLNLSNGCIVKHDTIIVANIIDSPQIKTTKCLQFIPNININLDENKKIIYTDSQYKNSL